MLNDDLRTTTNIIYFRNNCPDFEKKLDLLLLICTSLVFLEIFFCHLFVRMYIYFHCIYFSEILALRRYSSIRVEIKSTTVTTTTSSSTTTKSINVIGSSTFHRIS